MRDFLEEWWVAAGLSGILWLLVILALSLNGVFFREPPWAPWAPAPDTIVVRDTVYTPPPGWIDAFGLRCEWAPEERP